jgi:hypothetical protein
MLLVARKKLNDMSDDFLKTNKDLKKEVDMAVERFIEIENEEDMKERLLVQLSHRARAYEHAGLDRTKTGRLTTEYVDVLYEIHKLNCERHVSRREFPRRINDMGIMKAVTREPIYVTKKRV